MIFDCYMQGYKCVSQMAAASWINAVTAAVEDTAISKMHLTDCQLSRNQNMDIRTRTHCSGDKREFLQEICARHKIYARVRTVDMDMGGWLKLCSNSRAVLAH